MASRILASCVALVVLGSVGFAVSDAINIKECDGKNTYSGPLGRTRPIRYDMALNFVSDFDEPMLVEFVEIAIAINDTKTERKEPNNVIVLDSDKDIQYDSIKVYIQQWNVPYFLVPLTINDICRDSKEQILVIQTDEIIKHGSKYFVIINARATPKSDGRGLYWDEQEIKVNFGNSEAHLFMPSFDRTVDYKTSISARLFFNSNMIASGQGLNITDQQMAGHGRKTAGFATDSQALGDISFLIRDGKSIQRSVGSIL